ncbi:SLC13 family permease [bacterium]|nr:SLC13 family permease [bacterium]
MPFEQLYLLLVLALLIAGLIWERFRPSYVFLGAVALLWMGGLVESRTFVESLANTSILSIFLLIIITAGINEHFNLGIYLDRMFGKTKNPKLFLIQFGAFVSSFSAVINNTPLVAMLMPYLHDWGKRNKISPSKFFIPLSFFAISGGMITVIGTSTNLVLMGLVEQNTGLSLRPLDFVIPGTLIAVTTIVYMATVGYRLLPDRKDLMAVFEENQREYLVETEVRVNSILAGKTVEQAGLRSLKGVFLAEILREGHMITPVKPNEKLYSGDRLFFAGDTSQVIELIDRDNGLEVSKKEKLNLSGHQEIAEVVVPYNSLLSGHTVKESGFRERYDAAIIGIHRRGEKLSGKIGEIALQTGDLLLLTIGPDFRKLIEQDKNLYMVSSSRRQSSIRPMYKRVFLILMLLTVALAAVPASTLGIDRAGGILKLYEALFVILGLQFGFGMMDSLGVKKNVSLDLLVILAAALTLGEALIGTGTADAVAQFFIGITQGQGALTIGMVLFVLTMLLTSFVTNVAAISIAFPIAYSLSQSLGISGIPFFMIAGFGASCCYLTPVGYQTNLMVYGPGGYKFTDFFRVGIPLAFLYGLITIAYFATAYQLSW